MGRWLKAAYLIAPWVAFSAACGGPPLTPASDTGPTPADAPPSTVSRPEVKPLPSPTPVPEATSTLSVSFPAPVAATVAIPIPPVSPSTPTAVATPDTIPTATLFPTEPPHPLPTFPHTPEPTPTTRPTAALSPLPTSTPIPTLVPTPIPASPAVDIASQGESATSEGTYLIADGKTDTYELISSVLGWNPIENPDCGHPEFGPHIAQEWDDDLEKYAFVFYIHVSFDNDRCKNFDRQRNEIKAYSSSLDYLKGFLGETITYRWRFKLDDGFQPSSNFTHIHQLKDYGGNISSPIITLSPRIGSPDILEIAHYDSTRIHAVLGTAPLELFTGVWVEAYERMTFGHEGSYSIELRNLSTGALLLAYDDPNIDLWRFGAEFVRPKWGIYRSLNSQEYLRDEQVHFDRFCLAKGGDDCP